VERKHRNANAAWRKRPCPTRSGCPSVTGT
jgi:hypothetical protein